MPLSDVLLSEVILLGNQTIYGYHIVVSIYILIVVCLLIKLADEYRHTLLAIKKESTIDSHIIESSICKIQQELGVSKEVSVYSVTDIQGPFSIGVRNPNIILPAWWIDSCTEREIYYVLKHEYIHIVRNDLLIKLLMNVAVCLMFWNPCVYILRADFEQTLELECDWIVTRDMDNADKIAYMKIILNIIKNRKCYSYRKDELRVPALNLISNKRANIEERFRCISKKGTLRRNNIVLVALSLVVMLISYSFVFQTQYVPPIDEVATDDDTYELDFEKDVLIIEKNGDHIIRFENGLEISGNQISADFWIENNGKVEYR